eukprot:6568344-Prymnesium_polylepis.1
MRRFGPCDGSGHMLVRAAHWLGRCVRSGDASVRAARGARGVECGETLEVVLREAGARVELRGARVRRRP